MVSVKLDENTQKLDRSCAPLCFECDQKFVPNLLHQTAAGQAE
jgi:hypothetical protein